MKSIADKANEERKDAEGSNSLQETPKPAAEKEPEVKSRSKVFLRNLEVTGRTGAGLLLLGVLYTIYFARSLLLPVFLSLLLAAVLHPLVHRLSRLRVPEPAGAAIVVLLFMLVLGGGIYELSTPAADWMNRAPVLLQKAEYKISSLKQSILKAKEKTERIEDITKLGGDKEEEVVVKGPSLAQRIFARTGSILATFVVMMALIYFLLAQGGPTLHRLTYGFWEEEQGNKVANLLLKIQQDIASYLLAISIIYLVVGMITATAMGLLGMPTPVLWGGVATAFHFIPLLGPVITFLILCAVSFLTFDTWARILLPPLIYFCLAMLEGYVFTPIILGKRLTLNPIMVFGSILFWGWIWGIPGVFLSVPILASLKIICDDIEWLKPLGQILSWEKTKTGSS